MGSLRVWLSCTTYLKETLATSLTSPFPAQALRQSSNTMALLRDLSDEILVDILEFLTCDKATLCTLATVNKKFDGLATQLLARNIDVQVQTQDEGE